jgi:hypothetical protein
MVRSGWVRDKAGARGALVHGLREGARCGGFFLLRYIRGRGEVLQKIKAGVESRPAFAQTLLFVDVYNISRSMDQVFQKCEKPRDMCSVEQRNCRHSRFNKPEDMWKILWKRCM